MTAAQTAFYKIRGEEPSTTPAEVGKRIIRGVLHRTVDDSRTDLLNNVMHWSYGSGWGIAFGLVQGTIHRRPVPAGLGFGGAVWAASLVQLPAMRLAPPVWEYPPSLLASDIGFHLVYGATVGVPYAALGD